MKKLSDFQTYFITDLDLLIRTSQSNLMYENQTHFGDFLIEGANTGTDEDPEYFKLYRNNDENISHGEALIEIEYFGKNNGYTWETVFKYHK